MITSVTCECGGELEIIRVDKDLTRGGEDGIVLIVTLCELCLVEKIKRGIAEEKDVS